MKASNCNCAAEPSATCKEEVEPGKWMALVSCPECKQAWIKCIYGELTLHWDRPWKPRFLKHDTEEAIRWPSR